MICLLCGAKVPFFRRLSDPEYCSDAHRAEHERDMAEQALARLTRKPIPAKFAERPKEPEVELRPFTIPPLLIPTDHAQREPGEFGSHTSGFLVRPPAAASQLWDFLSEADNIAWTAALHIPSFFGVRSFTGLRIAGRQGMVQAAAGKPLDPRSLGADPHWGVKPAPLVLRLGPSLLLIAPSFDVPAGRPGLNLGSNLASNLILKPDPAEAAWQKLAAPPSALAETGARLSSDGPRFSVLPSFIRRTADRARITGNLAPRINSFLDGVAQLQPLAPAQAPKADPLTLRLWLARVEKTRFVGLISLPHALPQAGFASLVQPASVAVMRPPAPAPGFRPPRPYGPTRTQPSVAPPRLAAAAFTTLEAVCATLPPAAARVSAGVAILAVKPPTLPCFAASIAQPRRMSAASLESMIPQTSALPAAVPLNGAVPIAFSWRAAQPPAAISTSVPAMALVGVVRREKQNPVYAPARPRRSGSVPKPFRVSIRLGEFHVPVLEPGHPSETVRGSYRPAAVELEQPLRRAARAERDEPQVPPQPVDAPSQVETGLQRKLAAEASPLPVANLLDRLRVAWEGIPKLARAAIFAAPALAALMLYIQGTETNVAAGGGVVEVPASANVPPSP